MAKAKAKREKAEYMREYRKVTKAQAETEKKLLKELENKVNKTNVVNEPEPRNFNNYTDLDDAINIFKPNLKKTIKKPLKTNTYSARYDKLIADIA